jgi:hypothetical protein
MIDEKVEEELGASTPEDVYQRIVSREVVIKKMYVDIGLKGKEIDRTWDNLLGRARTNIRLDDVARRASDDILSSSHRRLVHMRG